MNHTLSTVTTTIRNCARCNKDHRDLLFTALTYPIEDTDGTLWSFWAKCPTNGEPILLKLSKFGFASETFRKDRWGDV